MIRSWFNYHPTKSVQSMVPNFPTLKYLSGPLRKQMLNMFFNGFKDVRANCFCASLLRTKFIRHVIHRAPLSSEVNNKRANCHC